MASFSTTTIAKRQTWSTCPTYCARDAAQLCLLGLSVRLSVYLLCWLPTWSTDARCWPFYLVFVVALSFRFESENVFVFLFVCQVSAYIRVAQIRILLLLLPLSMGMLPMRNWPRPKRLAKRWRKGGREREKWRREFVMRSRVLSCGFV